jgi:hypothetical protein
MSEWISVEDRLPDLELEVLGIDQFGTQRVCRLEQPWAGEPACWFIINYHGFFPNHWMSLPEPPDVPCVH